MEWFRRQQAGEPDRMLHLWRARMSLHRNDIAMFGVVRTSRQRYWPRSARPVTDDRADSAEVAAPRAEPTVTASVHRPQA
jgi:hypothetical protein